MIKSEILRYLLLLPKKRAASGEKIWILRRMLFCRMQKTAQAFKILTVEWKLYLSLCKTDLVGARGICLNCLHYNPPLRVCAISALRSLDGHGVKWAREHEDVYEWRKERLPWIPLLSRRDARPLLQNQQPIGQNKSQAPFLHDVILPSFATIMFSDPL